MSDPDHIIGTNTSSDLLDADNIPNDNQSHFCFSCDTPFVGLYCAQCGQKNDNYRRSILSLGKEVLTTFTALENRIWRTWYHIIRYPGRVAREYSDGARQKWSSPVRVYIAMSILLFGYISLTQTQLVAFVPGTLPTDIQESSEETTSAQNTPVELEVQTETDKQPARIMFLERNSKIQAALADADIDAFREELNFMATVNEDRSTESLEQELGMVETSLAQLREDLITQEYGKSGVQAGINQLTKRSNLISTELARRNAALTEGGTEEGGTDIVKPDAQTDVDGDQTDEEASDLFKFNAADGVEYELTRDGLMVLFSTVLQQPNRLNAPINTYIPRIMFFMMPLAMLLGAVFIRSRHNAMLYDHLVHAAYVHAFSFLLLFVFILLVQFTPIPGLLWIYTLILLIYLPLSAKTMFNRGWFKTVLTSYAVGLAYTFVMMLILFTLIIMGVLEIAKDIATTQSL